MDRPAAAALREAARAGPFFAVEPWTPEARWWPLRNLIENQAVRSERFACTRGVLATRARIAEERVAASIAFGGLASRLVSPQLARSCTRLQRGSTTHILPADYFFPGIAQIAWSYERRSAIMVLSGRYLFLILAAGFWAAILPPHVHLPHDCEHLS